MKVYLTKLEIPQIISMDGSYVVLHMQDEILSISEFRQFEEAEKEYENKLNIHMHFSALKNKNKDEDNLK